MCEESGPLVQLTRLSLGNILNKAPGESSRVLIVDESRAVDKQLPKAASGASSNLLASIKKRQKTESDVSNDKEEVWKVKNHTPFFF